MLLFVMRHGIAEPADGAGSSRDADRQLTREGAERTREVARGLLALGVRAGRIVTSPYLRAIQTATIVASVLGLEEERIEQSDHLAPGADPAPFVSSLQTAPSHETLVVGHAPDLDRLVALLLGAGPRPVTRLKKAGVACLELEAPTSGKATLLWLLEPGVLRELARARG